MFAHSACMRIGTCHAENTIDIEKLCQWYNWVGLLPLAQQCSICSDQFGIIEGLRTRVV